MKPELPETDQDRTVSPHAQEIEYALALQQMISVVKDDPAQLRLTIYEFARARLKIDALWATGNEQKRLSAALETAIQGVEQFSVRREEKERLSSSPPLQIGRGVRPDTPGSTAVTTVDLAPAPESLLVSRGTYRRPDAQFVTKVRTRAVVSALVGCSVGVLLLAVLAGLSYYRQGLPLLGERFSQLSLPTVGKQAASQPMVDTEPQLPGPVATAVKIGAASGPPPFPLPSDYGVYALSNGALAELRLLPVRVPDKRIAMSTPVTQPSQTVISDGKAKFILFRRDLAENAPDRIEVRVVAQVVRALTFDAKGKPGFTPIADAWNIRSVSYEFRVRPIPANPEMLLVQPEKADFALPAGRYVLVLKDQGYDFTVAGKITDVAQCLERTDAANGEFYSECQKL